MRGEGKDGVEKRNGEGGKGRVDKRNETPQ